MCIQVTTTTKNPCYSNVCFICRLFPCGSSSEREMISLRVNENGHFSLTMLMSSSTINKSWFILFMRWCSMNKLHTQLRIHCNLKQICAVVRWEIYLQTNYDNNTQLDEKLHSIRSFDFDFFFLFLQIQSSRNRFSTKNWILIVLRFAYNSIFLMISFQFLFSLFCYCWHLASHQNGFFLSFLINFCIVNDFTWKFNEKIKEFWWKPLTVIYRITSLIAEQNILHIVV